MHKIGGVDDNSAMAASPFIHGDMALNESCISVSSFNAAGVDHRPQFRMLPSHELRKFDEHQMTEYSRQKIKEYTDCLKQSYADLACLFQQLNKGDKRRILDAKEMLKSEVKAMIREVNLKNSK